jgi:hypothetical protein
MIEVTMRTRSIRKRLARLEKLTGPHYDEDGISLEEACRRWWKLDKKSFMKFAENKTHRLFVRGFQAEEDAEAASNARRGLHAR